MNVVVRHLGTDLPAIQTAFLRFAIGLIFVSPAICQVLRNGLPQGSLRFFAGRGLAHSMAVGLWFYAMARLPVAEVTAIGFLNPVLVTVGAALFLGERLAWRRILAIVVALIGALIILRPGLREIGAAHLAQLDFASAATIVAMMSLSVTVALLVPALLVWHPVSLAQFGWLTLVAAQATAGHYAMSRAFAAGPMAVTQPVVFLQLVWATLLGFAVFAEPVDPWVILGGAVIMAAIVYITCREAVIKRQTLPPAPSVSEG
jgi:drug/metabolite transporter (DMT)-like permease